MTPEEFVIRRKEFLKQLVVTYAEVKKMRAEVDNTLPTNLRPATANDIREGAVIWYKEGDDGPFWQIVDEVLHPNDPFKAYQAEDGSRYGLDDAWINIDQPTGDPTK